MALTPWPTGAAAKPVELAAADVMAAVALSPVATGRPAMTTSDPPVPPRPDEPPPEADPPPDAPSTDGIDAPDDDESDGADDDSALAGVAPRLGAGLENPPNAPDAEPAEDPPADPPAPMPMIATTPAASCSVRPVRPDSMMSLPLAA